MNLPKAKELLLNHLSTGKPWENPDYPEAIRLGLHAINRLSLARSYGDKHTLALLPGED